MSWTQLGHLGIKIQWKLTDLGCGQILLRRVFSLNLYLPMSLIIYAWCYAGSFNLPFPLFFLFLFSGSQHWTVDSFPCKTLSVRLSLFINIIVTNNVTIWLAFREISSSGVTAHKFLSVYPLARIIHMPLFLKIPTRNVGNLTNFDWAAPGQIEHLGKNFCISCSCASLNTLVTKF